MNTQILIAVINYGNEKEVLSYAQHLSQQTAKKQIALAIVANRWSENGKDVLFSNIKNVDLDVHIYDPEKNLGYLNGALFGYKSFMEETNVQPDWVVVSNTDIEYESLDFYERFLRTDYALDIGCIAPSAFVPTTGAYENPRYIRRFTRAELEKRIHVYQSNFISGVYQRLAAVKAKITRGEKKVSQYVYLAHGCFFMLRRTLADALCLTPYSALLYSEEAYVAEIAIQQGMRIYYDDGFQIVHHENAVTGKLNNPVRAKMYVDSLTMIRDQFYSDMPLQESLTKKDVCAVVISFNGADKLERNLRALYPQVARIVVVDNGSDPETILELEKLQKQYSVFVVRNSKNLGIGAALQQGLEYAHHHKFSLLLTMDQDSELCENAVEQMLNVMNSNAMVVSVGPEYGIIPKETSKQSKGYPVEYLITSGNLVRVNAAYCVGGFDAGLFIDGVDFDFSLKLRQNGYLLMKASNAFMKHGIGEKVTVKFLLWNIKCWTHSPKRHYYMSRNHVYICKRYRKYFKKFCFKKRIAMVKNITEVLLFHPQRKLNLAMMRRGRRDAARGILGEYQARQ